MLISTKISGAVRINVIDDIIPAPNEVLLHTEYCGICDSDYQKYLGHTSISSWGHEVVGRIVDNGQ